MSKAVKGILGIFTGGEKPKVDPTPSQELGEAARKAKKSRTALIQTEGGVAGQELEPDQVKSRSTLLGN